MSKNKSNTPATTIHTQVIAPLWSLLLVALLLLLMMPVHASDGCNPWSHANGTLAMANPCNDQTTPHLSSALPLAKAEWVVLPAKVYPYTAPSTTAPSLSTALCYPATIVATDYIAAADAPTSGPTWVTFKGNGRQLYLPTQLLVRKTSGWKPGDASLPTGKERVDRQVPLPLDYKANDLVKLNQKWNYHDSDMPKWLRAEAATALDAMLSEASKAGYDMQVTSAYRSAVMQRYLYLKKIAATGLDQKLVAKPGHSEHQLGTTVDICAPGKAGLEQAFGLTGEGKWLIKNVARFGFQHSYTKENRKDSGYQPEPWHIRYMGKAQIHANK